MVICSRAEQCLRLNLLRHTCNHSMPHKENGCTTITCGIWERRYSKKVYCEDVFIHKMRVAIKKGKKGEKVWEQGI